MFGLGIWEWLLIVALATLLFGPKFIARTFSSIFNSLKGFATSFQDSAKEPALNSASSSKALKPAADELEQARS